LFIYSWNSKKEKEKSKIMDKEKGLSLLEAVRNQDLDLFQCLQSEIRPRVFISLFSSLLF